MGGEKRAWYTLFAHAQFPQDFWEFGNFCKICSVTKKLEVDLTLMTDDLKIHHVTLIACYQLAQSILKIGSALAKKAG